MGSIQVRDDRLDLEGLLRLGEKLFDPALHCSKISPAFNPLGDPAVAGDEERNG